MYRPTGRVIDSIIGVSREEAQKLLPRVAQQHQFSSIDDLELHNQTDTQKGQAQQEVPVDVAQNFAGQSTNPNPTAPISNQARAVNGVPQWEVVDRETGSVLHTVTDHTMREAQRGMLHWLQSIGAEEPATYGERFITRPKMTS